MTRKTDAADRSRGGPGSSKQDATKPAAPRRSDTTPGTPTNPDRSRVSGGGGERDRHHAHKPATRS